VTAWLLRFFIDLPDPEGTGREDRTITVTANGPSGNRRALDSLPVSA
jgi:hypothetical protein